MRPAVMDPIINDVAVAIFLDDVDTFLLEFDKSKLLKMLIPYSWPFCSMEPIQNRSSVGLNLYTSIKIKAKCFFD